jgi:hypothetical protein
MTLEEFGKLLFTLWVIAVLTGTSLLLIWCWMQVRRSHKLMADLIAQTAPLNVVSPTVKDFKNDN